MIRAEINEKLKRKFRELAMKKFGYGKDALTKAVEEAILRWVSSVEEEAVLFEGDPVEAIEGILSEVDMDSVVLKHEIKDFWTSKVSANVSN